MNLIIIGLTGCLLIQILYWRFIFRRAGDDIQLVSLPEEETLSVSVVICFHKPWTKTPPVLHCLEQQKFQNFEIVLVNDGPVSLDPAMLQNDILSKNHIHYIEYSKTSPGKKGALSAGIMEAKNDWIALTDIDCQPGQDWLSTLSSHLPGHPSILLGYSPYTSELGLLNFIIRQETLLTAFQYLGWAREGHAYMGVGRNMAYHKSIYQDVTFDTHRHIPTGDDDLFVNEAARKFPVYICNESSSFVYSDAATSWKAWYRQKTRHKSGGKFYSLPSKIRLSIFLLALILEKFLLVFIIFVRIDLFLIFLGLKMIFTTRSLRKLYGKFDSVSNYWKMWIYEWFHVLYLILVAPYIFIITKQRWD